MNIDLTPNLAIDRSISSSSDEYQLDACESKLLVYTQLATLPSSMMAKGSATLSDSIDDHVTTVTSPINHAVFADAAWSQQACSQSQTNSQLNESVASEQHTETFHVSHNNSISIDMEVQRTFTSSSHIPELDVQTVPHHQPSQSVTRAFQRPKRPRVQVPAADGASKSHSSPRTMHTRGSPAVKSLDLNVVHPTGPIITPSFRALPLVISADDRETDSDIAALCSSRPVARIASSESQSISPGTSSNLDFASSPSYNSEAAMFYRHSWSLWQMRCEFLLNEVMRKVKKQITLARGHSNTAVYTTASKRRSKAGLAKSQSTPHSKTSAFAFPDLPDRSVSVASAHSSPSSQPHEASPAHVHAGTSTSSSLHTYDTASATTSQHADTNQPAHEPSAMLTASDISALASSSFSLDDAECINHLASVIPAHHSHLTLPVIQAMIGLCTLTVPPALKHERLFRVAADCLQLPLPTPFHTLAPHAWSSDHFFSYDAPSAREWTLPDERIAILYPHSTLPHHQAALESYHAASAGQLSRLSVKGGKSGKGGKRSLKRHRSPSPNSHDDLPPRHPPSSVSSIPSPHRSSRALGTPPVSIANSVARVNVAQPPTDDQTNEKKPIKSVLVDALGRIGGRKSKMTSAEKKMLNEARMGLFDAKLRRIGLVLSQERSRRVSLGQTVPRLSFETNVLTARQALPPPLFEAVERECAKLNVGVDRAWQELDWVARLIVTRSLQHLLPNASSPHGTSIASPPPNISSTDDKVGPVRARLAQANSPQAPQTPAASSPTAEYLHHRSPTTGTDVHPPMY